MNGIGGFIGLLFLLIAAFSIFMLVLMFKALQFTLTATNLYRKILSREDLIIKLLIDIRDDTKTFQFDEIQKSEQLISEESNITSAQQSRQSMQSKGPMCPECNEDNTYIDYHGNLFCRNCYKVTSVKEN